MKILVPVLLIVLMVSCTPKPEDTSMANIYAPGTINTHMSERDAALAPDGETFYFSVQLTRNHSAICYASKYKSKWMRPKVVEFSGKYMDLEPVFHPNGSLYFCSNRPLPGENEAGDYNIWFVRPEESGWSEPEPVDSIINSAGNEFYPSFTSNGDIYYTTTRDGGKGTEDIWMSKFNKNQYEEPVNLGDSINTPSYEYNSFIHPEGKYLLYTTHGWGDGFGSGDIYVSFKKENGAWTQPKNLGEKINTSGMEFCPSLSPDGKTLFFSRRTIPAQEGEKWSYFEMMSNFSSLENGQGNIYYIDADFINELR